MPRHIIRAASDHLTQALGMNLSEDGREVAADILEDLIGDVAKNLLGNRPAPTQVRAKTKRKPKPATTQGEPDAIDVEFTEIKHAKR